MIQLWSSALFPLFAPYLLKTADAKTNEIATQTTTELPSNQHLRTLKDATKRKVQKRAPKPRVVPKLQAVMN